MAIGLGLICLFLGLRQWYERRARQDADLSESDRSHFRRQDIRRWLGVGVLTLIALLILAGSQVNARAGNRVNLLFVDLWLIVLALVVLLLLLALADWSATRSYARRHRRELLRDSLNAIRQDARVTAAYRPPPNEEDPDPPPAQPGSIERP